MCIIFGRFNWLGRDLYGILNNCKRLLSPVWISSRKEPFGPTIKYESASMNSNPLPVALPAKYSIDYKWSSGLDTVDWSGRRRDGMSSCRWNTILSSIRSFWTTERCVGTTENTIIRLPRIVAHENKLCVTWFIDKIWIFYLIFSNLMSLCQ
jgi:hypothetical protein